MSSCHEIFEQCREFAKFFDQSHGTNIKIDLIVGPVKLKELWQDNSIKKIGAGLYGYETPDGRALYFGRSLTSVEGRLWEHLKTPQNLIEHPRKEQGFPNHQWAERAGVDSEINELFSRGEILAYAVKIQPTAIIALMEGYAIWQLKREAAPGSYLNLQD